MISAPTESLERKLDSLPNKPGVYLWKNVKGEVLYVGKAKRLRSRVRHYFADTHQSIKHRALLRWIADVDTIVVPSEAEALLLENNLIKEHRPRFNISLKDDKSYPSIAVTLGEDFPRVLVVRQLDIRGARYFGPYTDVSVLRRTLHVIRRIFTVRSCHYRLLHEAPDRPCLDYHIRRCRAPCVGYQDRTAYRTMIDEVIAFLEGKTVEVRARLRQRMDQASQELDYERAAELRNSLKWLAQLEQPQRVEVVGGGNADAIGFARDGDDAVGVVARIRGGRFVGKDQRFLENLSGESDGDVLAAFMVRHYLKSDVKATRVLLPFEVSDLDDLTQLLSPTRIRIPHRGKDRDLVDLADQNARHLMESFKIESFETTERAEDPVYALGRDLGLTAVPRSMACIDISTSQGMDTVGSLVWFEAGRPKKSEYRRYRIKGEQQNDFAAVAEVVDRFLRRRTDENKPLPDLLLIDGGKGQLSAARTAAAPYEVKTEFASIAKKEEEIYRASVPEPIRLSRSAPSLRLVQRMRDEAHRFAVEYNRNTRKKRTFASDLLNIPGVGPVRRRRLLERFGSLAGIKLATAAEIATIEGFSEVTAAKILDYLKE